MKEALQPLFDKAVAGLASQGFRQSFLDDADGTCAYRGADGMRCAIGWIIPDEVYAPGLEGHNVMELLDEEYTNYTSPPIAYAELGIDLGRDVGSDPEDVRYFLEALNDLQEAHDLSMSPGTMKLRLREYAEDHGLTIPEVLRE